MFFATCIGVLYDLGLRASGTFGRQRLRSFGLAFFFFGKVIELIGNVFVFTGDGESNRMDVSILEDNSVVDLDGILFFFYHSKNI